MTPREETIWQICQINTVEFYLGVGHTSPSEKDITLRPTTHTGARRGKKLRQLPTKPRSGRKNQLGFWGVL